MTTRSMVDTNIFWEEWGGNSTNGSAGGSGNQGGSGGGNLDENPLG